MGIRSRLANVVLGVIIFGWLLRRRSIVGPIVALAALAGLGVSADKLLGPEQLIGAMMGGLPLNISSGLCRMANL